MFRFTIRDVLGCRSPEIWRAGKMWGMEGKGKWLAPLTVCALLIGLLLLATLPLYLDHFHDYLARITEDHIYAWACTTSLG